MASFKTFSQREKERLGQNTEPEVYIYDFLPQPLRVQIFQILNDSFGPARVVDRESDDHDGRKENFFWTEVYRNLIKEAGVLSFYRKPPYEEIELLFIDGSSKDYRLLLDLIDIAFLILKAGGRELGDSDRKEMEIRQTPAEAIAELNVRFKQHGVGYRFENDGLMRIDSEFTHSEIVKPALTLLSAKEFSGPLDEFVSAHKHFREGEFKAAIVDALKSMESTLKTICKLRGWAMTGTETASALLQKVFDNGLIPAYLQSHFTALKSTLESGLPTLRNKAAGHGQGQDPVEVPEYLAAYALNLAATNIVFLIKASKT